MKANLILIISAVVIFASCSKTDDLSHVNLAAQNEAAARQSSPFTGSIDYVRNDSLTVDCDCGPYGRAIFDGGGEISHMGTSTSRSQVCYAPIFSGQTVIGFHVASQCLSIVAANGDILNFNVPPYDVMLNAQGIGTGTAQAIIAGGTGRFTSATGSISADLIDNVPLGTASISFNGMINY
ncbi:MAG TPA: hypothetical protein VE978_07595 [Chitinophagales bacterium]|nr:hypothetical protein [Chitinophagales bacterium]